eukprot:5977047-Pyramimonas_sp.AAC.1
MAAQPRSKRRGRAELGLVPTSMAYRGTARAWHGLASLRRALLVRAQQGLGDELLLAGLRSACVLRR